MAEIIKSPAKAIKAFCTECCGGSYNEAKLCPSQGCPLHAFRTGKNPYMHKDRPPLTDEQKDALRVRMAKLNAARKQRQEQAQE